MEIFVSQLFIYPVKGLPGITKTESELTPRGLKYDRRWMLVDENNRFLSQRGLPILTQFNVSETPNGFKITAPNKVSYIDIPYQIDGASQSVIIWEDTCNALHFSEAIDSWFTQIIGITCRLVFMPEQSLRTITEPKVPVNSLVSFADAFPLLIIGEASLTYLNKLLLEPMHMNRFRPNLVLDGTVAFEEDTFLEFTIGNNSFIAPKPCARCAVTTINQQTGEAGAEPLKTLSTFRKKENKIYFGENALCTAGFQEIALGNTIKILSRKKSKFDS
jgi:uncharacterized protein YcbX